MSRWIWPFELLERIGEGGMGVVYRARYVINDREVAVKMLPDDVTSPTVLARFEREMEVLKRLRHPNIVRSFGGVCEDKHRFYAMELVEGGSLENRLRERGRFQWEQVVDYGIQMCAALEYLHNHGVVHRDVKPANFLIADDGQLKLSDFGLASVVAARRITTAGKTAGTLLYMAPEQVRGEDVTPQTDLYALGCVLFELLTGKPPFVGETAAATLHKHCKEPTPRVSMFALDCPPALEKLITDLMEKEPSRRPADAAMVTKRLRSVTPEIVVVTRPRMERSGPETLKATKPVAASTQAGGRVPSWLVTTFLAALAAMIVWNLSLHRTRRLVEKSESLWVDATSDPHPDVRVRALRSLGKLGIVSEAGIEAIARNAQDEEPEVRLAAVESLGALGARAQSQVPGLVRVQKSDSDEVVRNAAAASVTMIQQSDSESGRSWMFFAVLTALGSVLAAVYLLRRYQPAWFSGMV